MAPPDRDANRITKLSTTDLRWPTRFKGVLGFMQFTKTSKELRGRTVCGSTGLSQSRAADGWEHSHGKISLFHFVKVQIRSQLILVHIAQTRHI